MKRRARRNPPGYQPFAPSAPWVPLLGVSTGRSEFVAQRMSGRAALLVMRLVGLEGDDALTPVFRGLATDGDAAKMRRRLGAAKRKLVASGAMRPAAGRGGTFERMVPEVQAVASAGNGSFGSFWSVEFLVKNVTKILYGYDGGVEEQRAACLILARECYDPVMSEVWDRSRDYDTMINHATVTGYGPVAAFAAVREAAGSPERREIVDAAFASSSPRATIRPQRQYGWVDNIVTAAELAPLMVPWPDTLGYQRPAPELSDQVTMLLQSPDTNTTAWFEKTRSGEYGQRVADAIRATLPYPSAEDAVGRSL